MVNKRELNQHTKKLLVSIVTIVVLIIAIAIGVFMNKGKEVESNEEIDTKEPIKVSIEQIVEYGDDIANKTFTIHTEDLTKEANFIDLDPTVDTMTVGITEHILEMENEIFDVTVVVEDTQNPQFKGVKDVIEFEGEEVDIEKELRKLISAQDPVDGELEVVFEIEEDKDKGNNFRVTADATDKNGNKTTESFSVVVKIVAKEEKEEADKTVEESKPTSVASKSENDSKPKQEKPKQEQPKQKEQKKEKPKQEEQKKETPKQEKPKSENKPKEKEENPPALDTGAPPLNNPSGLPSGATLSQQLLPSYHIYSYSKSIPGGGSITSVDVSSDYGGSATMVGTDNDGNDFIARYHVNEDKIGYQMIGPMGKPNFTPDDVSLLFEVGRAFARAYGMQ